MKLEDKSGLKLIKKEKMKKQERSKRLLMIKREEEEKEEREYQEYVSRRNRNLRERTVEEVMVDKIAELNEARSKCNSARCSFT